MQREMEEGAIYAEDHKKSLLTYGFTGERKRRKRGGKNKKRFRAALEPAASGGRSGPAVPPGAVPVPALEFGKENAASCLSPLSPAR